MGGGLMQLVAYGAQDIYLSGNPQITFFKVVYRRHTNFAVESIEQTHSGTAAAGSKISVTVSRNGDLLSQVWLVTTGASSETITPEQAFRQIDNVEVEIGGQVIDKQYGHWMQIWTDLTNPSDKTSLLDTCVGDTDGSKGSYVPLQFWFCRNPGLALPLIALQYHEVKLNITFASTTARLTKCAVWCDYVFLDTDERRRFAQVSHEYLIEQVQYSNALSIKGSTTQKELRFNHPVKELVWTVRKGAEVDVSMATATTVPTANLTSTDIEVDTALLQLNGHDRFKRREGKYFTAIQRYQHHSGSSDSMHRPAIVAGVSVSNKVTTAASKQITVVNANHSYVFESPTLVTLSIPTGLAGQLITHFGPLGTAADPTVETIAGYSTSPYYIASRVGTDTFSVYPTTDGTFNPLTGEITLKGSAAALTFFTNSDADADAVVGAIVATPVAIAPDNSIPHVYSFALKPEEHQPSGTCNFSRIDNAVLNMTHADVAAPATLKVYAVNYNVLRIMSGMGGLAYSN
jgi:hypothetical protein